MKAVISIRTTEVNEELLFVRRPRDRPTYGNGLMAPRVAICAGHEANMITRLLLGEEDV